MNAQDREYVRRARANGAQHAYRIILEARRAGIPLSWAFALVEQESNFENIYGCDWGRLPNKFAPPYCRVPVTKERNAALLRHGKPNGVGLTQLTDFSYVRRAERTKVARAFGAHLPGNQIRVGMEVLKEKTGSGGMAQAWRYNGSREYQPQIKAKQRKWHNILT